ncbi:MAG: flavodoxin family protein [Lachnospiraceae bacterium]|nr:flavodoxin family protein [Lachnospiraceae bacterium]
MNTIKILGISASPRKGNSEFILTEALKEVQTLPFDCEVSIASLRGREIKPCVGCFACRKNNGHCFIKDDFEELREQYLAADVIIYSVPLFNYSIPGQLKCFIDRLGQAMTGYYGVRATRPLKVCGNIIQGAHLYGGQDFAITTLTMHEMLAKCIPIAGDGWESYTGAGGWTAADASRDAFKKLYEAEDKDTLATMRAARSVVKRAVETAAIIKCGAEGLYEYLSTDEKYGPLCRRVGISKQ